MTTSESVLRGALFLLPEQFPYTDQQCPLTTSSGGIFFYTIMVGKKGIRMPDEVERLVNCGMNLADAFEVVDDFLYDSDYQGLTDYIMAVERESREKAAV